jgi:hypothetical protein
MVSPRAAMQPLQMPPVGGESSHNAVWNFPLPGQDAVLCLRCAGMNASNDNLPDAQQFSQALVCPECGQKGSVVWSETILAMPPLGSRRLLLFVSPGFHAESGRTHSGEVLVVCSECDMIQPC